MTRDEFVTRCDDLSFETKYSGKPWHIWLAEMTAHDAEQRATIEQQAKKIQELEDWQKIVTGTGTDQETVVRMAATEYTKVAVQCWKEKCEQQAQEIARLREELKKLVDLLGGDASCRLDHHGYCQEHFLTAPCEVQQAQQALKETGK